MRQGQLAPAGLVAAPAIRVIRAIRVQQAIPVLMAPKEHPVIPAQWGRQVQWDRRATPAHPVQVEVRPALRVIPDLRAQQDPMVQQDLVGEPDPMVLPDRPDQRILSSQPLRESTHSL